jgi:DNA-binding NarL/FixJ family response regulator
MTTKPRKIDLLIIESQGLTRALLREFLQSYFPHLSIGEAGDGGRALTLVRTYRPSVILIGNDQDDGNRLELTAQVKSLLPEARPIILTKRQGESYLDCARAAGAFACVEKQKILTELLPVVTTALTPVPSQDRES